MGGCGKEIYIPFKKYQLIKNDYQSVFLPLYIDYINNCVKIPIILL